MMTTVRALVTSIVLFGLAASSAFAQAPVTYLISVPEPEHHWLEVEATFIAVPAGEPLTIRMSRSSPGRYAVHEFAKNIFRFEAFDVTGTPLAVERPTVSTWRISGHNGSVRVVYRIFGDRIDGTYLGVDSTHAHINMPATLVWAEGLEVRPARVTFVPPPGRDWTVATQLFSTAMPLIFTAPNLQYLLDSPAEFSDHILQSVDVTDPTGETRTIRAAIHHAGTDANVAAYMDAVVRVVRAQAEVFGEIPAFDSGHFTFLADYLPWANGDGMEHRNSTVVTGQNLTQGLGTASHEFFHVWNVERIRPADLEPFDFTDADVSGALWFAEGFTNYYGPLTLARAGLAPMAQTVSTMGRYADAIVNGSGRVVRSPIEMSRHAPFVDAAAAIDRTDFSRSFISYYTYGAGIAFGLDLTLRQRSGNEITLDHYMRGVWTKYGKPSGEPGVVVEPYTIDDLRDTLAEVADDEEFAREFFAKYIEGREAIDYASLVGQAGLVIRPRDQSGWIGDIRTENEAGELRITSLVPFDTPAYNAGLDFDQVIVSLNGATPTTDLMAAVAAMTPGSTLTVVSRTRDGRESTREMTVLANPHVELVPIEATGGTPTAEQLAFRASWLGIER